MRIVIIGNGMVGYKFCEKLVGKTAHELEITVFGEEMRPAYDRVHLSEYFAGKSAEDLSLAPAGWYKDNRINFYPGDPVRSIDRTSKTITSHNGITAAY